MRLPCCGGGIEDEVLNGDKQVNSRALVVYTEPPQKPEQSTGHQRQQQQQPPEQHQQQKTRTSPRTSQSKRPDPEEDGGAAKPSPLPRTRRASGRDSVQQLGSSLQTSWNELVKDNPHVAEDTQVRRAIELSLLDYALVIRDVPPTSSSSSSYLSTQSNHKTTPPHVILGVRPDATVDEIKATFRQKALRTHPDKGGKQGDFERIAVAYRTLLTQRRGANSTGDSPSVMSYATTLSSSYHTPGTALKTSAHWDKELKEHKDLVAELFASHSTNVNENVAKQHNVRELLGLKHVEAGSSNINEKQERIRNSCFYLSLAVSYLSGIGALEGDFPTSRQNSTTSQADQALISQTALQLKRTIEGAVLQAHPEWARAGLVGEEVQAFSDFLVYTLESSSSILPDWAVAIFDETSGFVDVYKGCQYGQDDDDWVQRANTLTLRFVPGHYQPLLPHDQRRRPTLDEILTTLDHEGVFYVVTDGTA